MFSQDLCVLKTYVFSILVFSQDLCFLETYVFSRRMFSHLFNKTKDYLHLVYCFFTTFSDILLKIGLLLLALDESPPISMGVTQDNIKQSGKIAVHVMTN